MIPKTRPSTTTLQSTKPERIPKGAPSCQQSVIFDERVRAGLPQNLRFYRVDEKTTSYHYHMNKKPLTTMDCKIVETLLRLKHGTCYVMSDWMRLKAITNMHKEWNDISRNVKTADYKQVQDHLGCFFEKALKEFEVTYAELLQQPQVKDVYFVKIRDRSRKKKALLVALQQQQQQELNQSLSSSSSTSSDDTTTTSSPEESPTILSSVVISTQATAAIPHVTSDDVEKVHQPSPAKRKRLVTAVAPLEDIATGGLPWQQQQQQLPLSATLPFVQQQQQSCSPMAFMNMPFANDMSALTTAFPFGMPFMYGGMTPYACMQNGMMGMNTGKMPFMCCMPMGMQNILQTQPVKSTTEEHQEATEEDIAALLRAAASLDNETSTEVPAAAVTVAVTGEEGKQETGRPLIQQSVA